jgi:hypothetical protein
MRRGATALALCALTQGCVTGHLLDAARRYERPLAYREVFLDGDRLLLEYTVLLTDDDGRPLGRTERHAAIALADLRRAQLPVERFPVARLDRASLRGQRVALSTTDIASPPFLELERGADGRDERFVLHDGRDDSPYAAFYSSALTRSRTALWAYPLLPVALAVDVVSNPVLLFFAPAMITIGD